MGIRHGNRRKYPGGLHAAAAAEDRHWRTQAAAHRTRLRLHAATAMNTRSIGFRLTVWYAAALSAGFALFGTLIWFSLRHQMIAEIDRELDGSAGRFITYFRSESADAGAGLRD